MEILFCFYYVVLLCSIYFGVQYTILINTITFGMLLVWEWKNRKLKKRCMYGTSILLVYVLWWIYLIMITTFNINLNNILELKVIIDLIFLKTLTAFNTLLFYKNADKEKILLKLRDFTIVLLGYGIIEYIFDFSIIDVIQLCRDRRLQTIFLNPIIYGTYLTFIWSISLVLPYNNKKYDLIFKMLLMANLLLTLSRSSWIPFVMITLLFVVISSRNGELKVNFEIWKTKNWREGRNVKIPIIIVVIGGGIFLFKESIVLIFQSVLQRINIIDMIQSQPFLIRIGNILNVMEDYLLNGTWSTRIFGKGMMAAREVVKKNPVEGWQDAVDNQYITTLYDYGIVGIALLFVLFCCIVKYCKTVRDKKKSMMLRFMMINVTIGMFFYEMLEWSATISLFSLMIGIMLTEYEGKLGGDYN